MLDDWILRLRSIFRRSVVEQELDEELQFHLEQQIESYLRAGFDRDEAVHRARLDFGRLDQIKEEHRAARGVRLIDDLVRDAGSAARQVRRSLGFIIVVVLCVGLFDVFDTVLRRGGVAARGTTAAALAPVDHELAILLLLATAVVLVIAATIVFTFWFAGPFLRRRL